MSQKLTPEELKQIQDIKTSTYEIVTAIGDLNYKKTLINLELEAIKEQVKKNATAEREIMQELGKKYGDGSINIETGEITPAPQA